MDNWECYFQMCPSQCYLHKQYNNVDYVFYLRWRWGDPWQAHIINNATSQHDMNSDNTRWSEDLFALHGIYYTHNQHMEAKQTLIDLWLFETGQSDG